MKAKEKKRNRNKNWKQKEKFLVKRGKPELLLVCCCGDAASCPPLTFSSSSLICRLWISMHSSSSLFLCRTNTRNMRSRMEAGGGAKAGTAAGTAHLTRGHLRMPETHEDV